MHPQYLFLLGGHDLEMTEIRKLLDTHQQPYIDRQLAWGARMSDYADIITEAQPENRQLIGIELSEDLPIPAYYQSIDHHNEKAHLPASIEQLASLLGLSLNRFQQLVAANDRGYIPAMSAMGATQDEIDQIRLLDRRAQGVTEEMERQAEADVQHKRQEESVTVVRTSLSRFSPLADRLQVQRLLIYNESALTFYGTGADRLAHAFSGEISDGKAYYGGGATGYFGFGAGCFSSEEIEHKSRQIINHCNNMIPISKHVFLFPFRWDFNNKAGKLSESDYSQRTSTEKFHAILTDSGSLWDPIRNFSINSSDDYNARTYFYPYARAALFPDKTDSLLNYYKYQLSEEATYSIQIASKDTPYVLSIKSITLSVYKFGIGVLSFSLENYNYDKKDDILIINDYGRRIYPQFLGKKFSIADTQYQFLAKYIHILDKSKSIDIKSTFEGEYQSVPDYLPPHILELLSNNKKTEAKFVATDPKQGQIRIRPILDDRMFLICWYGNSELSSQISKFDESTKEYNLHTNENFLYRYTFVDTSLTCPDELMRNKLLEQTVYTRWIPFNTIYGVSRYSFVILTGNSGKETDKFDFVRDVISIHLTNLYSRLIQLCLVQRATLLRFSGEISYLSQNIDNEKTELTDISEQVQTLNKDYLLFENRINLREITAQEQGIELYDLALKQMRIPETVDDVRREIRDLDNYLQVKSQEGQRLSLERLSLLGGLFLIPGFIMSYFGWGILDINKLPIPKWGYLPIIIIIFVLLCAGYLAFIPRPNRVIDKPKSRNIILYIMLGVIGWLVIFPFFIIPFIPNKPDSRASVIDSVSIQHIDSLNSEIRKFKQLIQKRKTSKPDSTK